MKKIKCHKIKRKFFFYTFCENHPPTRHIKYKVIDFAPSNKSVMANKLLLANLELFMRRIKSTLRC